MRFAPPEAQAHVLVFKDGLFSAVAHDLRLRVGSFTLEAHDDGALDAHFDIASLVVETALREGRELPGALGALDKRDIEATMAKVLDSRRYPEARFLGRHQGKTVTGELSLHGTTRPLRVALREADGRYIAEIALEQPDFGITPYRAALGALKVKPGVRIIVSVPLPSGS